MAETISLREASRRLSRCVEAAEAGQKYIITRNGTRWRDCCLWPVQPSRRRDGRRR